MVIMVMLLAPCLLINTRESTSMQPIHLVNQPSIAAFDSANLVVTKLLLAAGADPHLRDNNGRTVARERNTVDCIHCMHLIEVSRSDHQPTLIIPFPDFFHSSCQIHFLSTGYSCLTPPACSPLAARSINDAHFATSKTVKEAIGQD